MEANASTVASSGTVATTTHNGHQPVANTRKVMNTISEAVAITPGSSTRIASLMARLRRARGSADRSARR